MRDGFSYYAPAYLIKGGATGKTIKVGGCITSETKDTQGEVLLSKGLDFSYFTGGWGKIKYEHGTETPDNIIGAPTKIIKKGKEIHFEGELFSFEGVPDDKLTPQQKMAKSAYGLLQMTEEHNKRNPNNPQKVGWSVEGEYLDRDKRTGLVKKAKIVNVVLTTKPVNTTTFATLLKSLEVGHGTSPETQTGLGATQKESIDGKTKNVSSNKETKRMVFQNKEDLYKALVEKGVDEESARKEADKWESEQDKKRKAAKPEPKPEPNPMGMPPGEGEEEEEDEKKDMKKPGDELPGEDEPALKSLQLADNLLKKSIDFCKKANSVTVSSIDIQEYDNQMNKALELSENPDGVDISNYLIGKHEVDKGILEGQDGLAAKITMLTEAQNLMAKSMRLQQDYFRKSLAELSAISSGTIKGVTALVKSMARDTGSLVTDRVILSNYQYAGNNTDDVQLSKGQKVEILDKLADAGTIKSDVVMRYESSGYLDPAYEEIIKSNRNLLKK